MNSAAKRRRLPRATRKFLLGSSGDLPAEPDKHALRSLKNYALVVPPGEVVLRKISIPAVRRRERVQTLMLAAEPLLTGSLDHYLIDYWHIGQNDWGLAAIPRQLLLDYHGFVDKTGRTAGRIEAPELTIDLKDGIVLWVLADAVTVCIWRKGVLSDWQTIPRSNGPTAVGRYLAYAIPDGLNDIVLRTPNGGDTPYEREIKNICSEARPGLKIRSNTDSLTKRSRRFLTLCTFPPFIQEQAYQPASPARKRGALLAGIVLLASIVGFLVVQLRDLESQAAKAEHATSLLKMQAARSTRIADRVSRLMAEMREVRSLNQTSVVGLLDDLSVLMPSTMRLVGSLQIDRRGILAMDGVSDEKQDIGGFVRQLNRHPWVQEVRLQSVTATRQKEEKGIRFRIQIKLKDPLWTPEDGENES